MVIFTSEPTTISKKIAQALETDKKHFFVITSVTDTFFRIFRGTEFDKNKSMFGAVYYAHIVANFEKHKYELAEELLPHDGQQKPQVNIFGYFASPKVAAKNLLRLGNTSFDGRPPKEIYSF